MGKTACWSHDNHRCHEVFAKCRTGMCVNSTRRALTRLQALLCGGVLHKALGIPDNEGNEKNEHEGITKRGVGGGGLKRPCSSHAGGGTKGVLHPTHSPVEHKAHGLKGVRAVLGVLWQGAAPKGEQCAKDVVNHTARGKWSTKRNACSSQGVQPHTHTHRTQ